MAFIGKTVWGYKIAKEVGRGGMGNVYLGQHTTLDKKVAIKVINREYSARQDVIKRFKSEASIHSLIGRHPNIIEFINYFPEGDNYYIVMEYFESTELADEIDKRGAISEKRAIFIAKQILNGIGHAHKRGIVHRDIKTPNILINKKDEIKLKKPLNNILKFNDYNEYIDLIREFTMVDIFIVQANGITTGGEILFQDEIGNKIAGVVFGPQRVIILCDSSNIYDDVDEFLDQRKGNVFSIIYGSMEGHKDRVYLIHIMEKI